MIAMSELGHDIQIITHSLAVGSVARRHGNKDLLKILLFMSSAAYHLTAIHTFNCGWQMPSSVCTQRNTISLIRLLQVLQLPMTILLIR